MSTTTATLTVDASQAINALNKVGRQLDVVGNAFTKLGNIVAGLAIGTYLTNILRAADATDELSKATGISIAAIEGLNSAFIANGGDADQAQQAVGKFTQTLGDLADGNQEVLDAFQQLGISVQELRTLSEEDLLRKTIKGLGEMEKGATRTSIAVKLFGRNIKSVDFDGVNNDLDNFIAKSKQAEPGIKSAANLFGNIQNIGKSFATELTTNFSGLTGTLEKLTSNTEAIAKSLVTLTNVVIALSAAWFFIFKLPRYIRVLNDGIMNVSKAGGVLASVSKNIKDNFEGLFKNLAGFLGLEKLFGRMANASTGILALYNALKNIAILGSRLTGIGIVVGIINELISKVTGINLLGSAFKFLADIAIISYAGYKMLFELFVKIGQQIPLFQFIEVAFKKGYAAAVQLLEPLERIRENITYFVSQAFPNWVKMWNEVVDAAKDYIGLGRSGVPVLISGETDDRLAKEGKAWFENQRKIRANIEARKVATKELDAFNKKLREVTDQFNSSITEKNRAIDLEIAFAQSSQFATQQLQAQYEAYDAAVDAIQKLIDLKTDPANEKYVNLIQKEIDTIVASIPVIMEDAKVRIEALQAITTEQDKLLKSTELLKQQLESETSLNQLRDQIELIGLMGDELEDATLIMQVSQELESKLVELRQQELDLIARKTELTDQQFQNELSHINALRTAASQYANDRLEAERAILEAQRATQENAAAGAKQAIKDIADQFKPYNMAQEAVKKGWDAIGNAVDQFVETGKFKFSDFARSVIQDLAKMIAKAMIFKAISAALGAFGISIPGMAKGGKVEGGSPYIVGEKGPELFVPQGSGKIVPNNQLGTSSQGGMTASAGPITNNYNTYNINALDAKSVAQLFAENRKAIFGANKMAEREMSYAGVR